MASLSFMRKSLYFFLSCCPLLSSLWEDDSQGQLGAPAVVLREKENELGLGEPWRWEEARLRFLSKGRPAGSRYGFHAGPVLKGLNNWVNPGFTETENLEKNADLGVISRVPFFKLCLRCQLSGKWVDGHRARLMAAKVWARDAGQGSLCRAHRGCAVRLCGPSGEGRRLGGQSPGVLQCIQVWAVKGAQPIGLSRSSRELGDRREHPFVQVKWRKSFKGEGVSWSVLPEDGAWWNTSHSIPTDLSPIEAKLQGGQGPCVTYLYVAGTQDSILAISSAQ